VSQTLGHLDATGPAPRSKRDPNQLVYLPRPHRVKKVGGVAYGQGKSDTPNNGNCLHALYSETRCQSVGSENRVYGKHGASQKKM
jgi:hypothetical protein